ncbi:MAG: hypothetical protein K2L48_00115 [Mycoplasmoidaceae bacterium]|nr:hypothetical protein [Mycoplasmoidaceae bacterium]
MQNLNAQTNKFSKEIGSLIDSGKKQEAEELKNKVKEGKTELISLSSKKEELESELNEILYSIPNLPDKSVPIGKDENENVEIKKFSTPTKFDFKPLAH